MQKSLLVSDLTHRLLRSTPRDVTPSTSEIERMRDASELTVTHHSDLEYLGKFPSKNGNDWVKLPAKLDKVVIDICLPHHIKSLGTYDLNRMKMFEVDVNELKLNGVLEYLPIIGNWLNEKGYVTEEDNLFDLLMLGSALSKFHVDVIHDLTANHTVHYVTRSTRGKTATGEYDLYLTRIRFEFLRYARVSDFQQASLIYNDDPDLESQIRWNHAVTARVLNNQKYHLTIQDLYEVISSDSSDSSDHSKGKKEKNKSGKDQGKEVTSSSGIDAETQALFDRPLSSLLLPM